MSTTTGLTSSTADASTTASSTLTSLLSSTLDAATTTSILTSSTTTDAAASASTSGSTTGSAQSSSGISLVAFLTALVTSLIIFAVQAGLFLLLRNKLARIFKPKTFLVPERERTEPPPVSPWGLIFSIMGYKDRELIKKCGLDAYFFLRYLQTLLVIFIPIALVVIPVLVPINYIGGIGQSIVTTNDTNTTTSVPTGLDTLAWGNVAPTHQKRRWAHLILAVLVILWVCFVFFTELRVYIKVRQDELTSAEHRLRASANTVLVSSIPDKWLTEDALRGLFDVFPGGIRNIWLTRDFTKLLDKIHKRDAIHKQLEAAESELIRKCKKKQIKVKAKEDRRARRGRRERAATKAERAEKEKTEDEEAKRRAASNGGISAGDHEELPTDVTEAVEESEEMTDSTGEGVNGRSGKDLKGIGSKIGGGLVHGLKKGVTVVGGAGQGILGGAIGGAKAIGHGVDGELERTNGFEFIRSDQEPTTAPSTRGSDRPRRAPYDDEEKGKVSFASDAPIHGPPSRHAHTASVTSQLTQDSDLRKDAADPRNHGNTTRKLGNPNDMYVHEVTKWYQFWKPPTGAYASPVPQGSEDDEYPWNKSEKTFWQKVKAVVPFFEEDEEPIEYEKAYTTDYEQEKEDGAQWRKWIRPKDRPHHRLPLLEWTPGWLPGLPLIHKRVDTIYWCRTELARLNLEIEEDQAHPERYPIMKSAFIQFNNQVAAHMACQSVTHHVPKNMAPRMVEISPDDVIWDNMAIKWWDESARTFLVFVMVVAMVILWAGPVAWTASLSQIDALVAKYSWLDFLQRDANVYKVVKAIAGVLPAAVLAILLALVPVILDFLAQFQGSKTGAQKAEVVQVYYFLFLFVQVFLVVSITSGTWASLSANISNVTEAPRILAQNLPRAANYFFSYMILQALSTSSGTLLQVGTLFVWYILARILDDTARSKWRRNTQLPTVTWGSFFPVYTNFACIAIIYSIVAPIISIFAIITFSLLWAANRYNMLFVTRFRTDTGGVLYPRAINQTFVGLYFMELCLIGLFFLSEDENGNNVGFPMAIVMIVMLFLTALYQYLLNSAFGPLFRYLPITFEDEAVLRDEAFQRAQDRRLGLLPDDDEATSLVTDDRGTTTTSTGPDGVELRKISRKDRTDTGASQRSHFGMVNPVKGIKYAGSWAVRGGKQIRAHTFGKAEENLRQATDYRRRRRQKDLEAQRAIGEALFGGYHDEIEDLTPEERDALVRKAFQHYALRARQPVVWIPRDDIGVSDDEIARTQVFSRHIWISNEGTALDSKVRVVYGRNPPDFTDVDLIVL